MGKSENRSKDSAMAAHLVKSGYPHGKRKTSGLSGIPDTKSVGSAAYRRRIAKQG